MRHLQRDVQPVALRQEAQTERTREDPLPVCHVQQVVHAAGTAAETPTTKSSGIREHIPVKTRSQQTVTVYATPDQLYAAVRGCTRVFCAAGTRLFGRVRSPRKSAFIHS